MLDDALKANDLHFAERDTAVVGRNQGLESLRVVAEERRSALIASYHYHIHDRKAPNSKISSAAFWKPQQLPLASYLVFGCC